MMQASGGWTSYPPIRVMHLAHLAPAAEYLALTATPPLSKGRDRHTHPPCGPGATREMQQRAVLRGARGPYTSHLLTSAS